MVSQDIQQYINFIKETKPLPKKRQHELCILIKTSKDIKEVEKAKTQLIECNLKFVVKCANRFKNSFNETNVDVNDLISRGNIGLIEAVDKYDPFNESGANFTSFAFPIINHHIINAIKSFRLIRVPSTYYVYSKKISQLSKSQVKDPSDQQICKELNIQQDTLDMYKKLIKTQYDPIDNQDDSEQETNIKELTTIDNSGFEKISSEEFRNFMKKHLDKLPEKHKDILIKLYMENENVMLDQVAKTFGQSKQNIAATKDRALEKLKKSLILDKSMGNYLDFKNNA